MMGIVVVVVGSQPALRGVGRVRACNDRAIQPFGTGARGRGLEKPKYLLALCEHLLHIIKMKTNAHFVYFPLRTMIFQKIIMSGARLTSTT